MLALLGSALTYHQSHLPHLESLHKQNWLLIYWCFNILNWQAELSRPQVMSYLMDWNNHFTSHQYVSVYWGQLANALEETYQFSEDRQEAFVEEEKSDVVQNFSSIEVCFSKIAKNHLNYISLMIFFLIGKCKWDYIIKCKCRRKVTCSLTN